MKRICVFAGSSAGARPDYLAAADRLAVSLLRRRIELVYGGASVGLMGRLADCVVEGGGTVIGVIPNALRDREIAHRGLTELRVVASMHERKATMTELADGFVVMPGGLGTLDETFEVLTWAQLGMHQKPLGLLNVGRYYDRLLQFLEEAEREQFLAPAHRHMVLVDSDPAELLDRMATYRAPTISKWIERETA